MAVLGCTGGAGATIRNGAADAAAEVGGGGDLRGAAPFPFLPSNVPLAALVGAEGKLVFDAESCGGRSEVEIDTTEGSVGCPGGEAAPRFRSRRVVDAGGNGLALLVARSLLIERKMVVSVRGELPLAIVVEEDATIMGILRASAEGSRAGAGGFPGPPVGRTSGNGPGAGTATAAGGGGGGSYCGAGGDGGPGHLGGQGNEGGPRYGTARVVPLVAGSSGGNGGDGEAGGGGGAIQISAGHQITVDLGAVVHVGGGGGDREGAGGGSGGAILLEAPLVLVSGVLAANGGGGGSSANAGSDATPDARAAAGGGAARMNTGDGGQGAAGVDSDGTPGSPNPTFVNGDYSGGGGGGSGYIRVNGATALLTGTLSPALGSRCASRGALP